MATNPWRDPEREIAATCAILDLLSRRVWHAVKVEVRVMSFGDMVADVLVDLGDGKSRRTHFQQAVLSDEDFPTFAARHIESFVLARLRSVA